MSTDFSILLPLTCGICCVTTTTTTFV